jgi:hypothetical protein
MTSVVAVAQRPPWILLTPEQRARLERLATRRGVSVGAIVREAVDAYTASRSRSRGDALESLCSLDAPVGDWPAMKAQIIDGVVG